MKHVLIATIFGLGLARCQHMTPDYHARGAKLNGPPLSSLMTDLDKQLFENAMETNDDVAKPARRELVFALIALSDTKCENYLVGVSAHANATRAGLGVGGLALGTAGGLATPERSANLLSSLSTLFSGTATELQGTVFGGRDFPVIYTAIRNGRRAERERIYDATNRGSFDTWGPRSIASYVNAYDMNCGINYGLQQIAEAVDQAGDATRRDLIPQSSNTNTPTPNDQGRATEALAAADAPRLPEPLEPSIDTLTNPRPFQPQ